METLRLAVDPASLDTPEAVEALEQAAGLLRAGETVAMPTETVYGLAANALDPEAVRRIFEAKGRPGWDPLIVHVADRGMLAKVAAEVPEAALKLMDAFWPGPLTLLLPRAGSIPESVTAGRALVGVRMPSHPVARALIRAAGVPLAAPSANRFGHTSPTSAAHVLADLDGRIAAVLDAGQSDCGVESTVLDPTQIPMVIYRPGAVTLEQIRAVAGAVEMFAPGEALVEEPRAAMPSPGVGLRHYAPRARVELVEAGIEAETAWMPLGARLGELGGERAGVMLPLEWRGMMLQRAGAAIVFDWGRWSEPGELAQRLFAGLRWLDEQGVSVILCPLPGDAGIGRALRDRLMKAASRAGIDD